jgi:hypothetical protein
VRRRLGKPSTAAFLAPVVAPISIFIGALTGRVALLPGDGYQTYLPWFTHAATAWRQLTLPGWNPSAFAGSPLLAVSQAGVYYPPNFSFVFLPTLVAANLSVVFSFVVAGVGAFLLARHLTGDDIGAAVAGVSFGLCGFMFAHVGHTSMLASAAWLPWVLWGYDRLRERFTPGRVLVGSGCLALSFLAGHSHLAFTIVMAVGVYAAGSTALIPRPARGRPILAAAALLVAAAGLSGAQLLPTARYVEHTNRGGVAYTEAMTYSMPVSHTPLLLFPYLYGNQVPDGPFSAYAGRWNLTELTGYPGMAALVLAAAGIGAARRDRRLMALALTAAVAAALALGPGTPLSRLVFHVPVYGQFRSWARYLIVVDLVVAVAAAYGVRRLRRASPAERRRAVAAAGAAGLGLVIAGLTLPHVPQLTKYTPQGLRPAAILLPLCAGAAGVACAVMLARNVRWATALAVLFVAMDATISFGWFAEWRRFSISVDAFHASVRSRQTFWGGVNDQPGGIDRYLFIGGDIAPMRSDFVGATDLKGFLSANGSGPLAPADYLEAMGMSAFGSTGDPDRLWGPRGRTLDLLRVSTVLVDKTSAGAAPPSQSSLGTGHPVPATTLLRYDRDPALSEAFLVGRAEIRSRPAILSALRGDTEFDPASVALIEQPCRGCPLEGPPGPAGTVRRLSGSAGSATFEIDAERPAVMVVSQAWLPGWTATLGGKRVPAVRVDGLVQGVPVPAGQYRLVLRYQAPGARTGLAVSAITALVLVAASAWVGRARWPVIGSVRAAKGNSSREEGQPRKVLAVDRNRFGGSPQGITSRD